LAILLVLPHGQLPVPALYVAHQLVLPVKPFLPFIWATFNPAIESWGVGVVLLEMAHEV